MSNFAANDPELSVGGMQALIWVETAIAIAAIGIRALIRLQDRERLSIDDAFAYFALFCMIVSSGLYTPVLRAIFILSSLETGELQYPPANFMQVERRYLSHQFALIILFWTTLWSIKGSFLAFYRHMFSGQFVGWQRIAWYVATALCIVTWISNFILQFFSCAPFNTYFAIGSCNTPRDFRVSNDSLYYATATDIITDLLIMALPLSILWKLQLDKRTRLALGGVFLTGFVIILFAILRLVYTVPRHAHVNPKWLAVWSTTESCIAVMVSCTPPLRKYFVKRGRQRSAITKTAATPGATTEAKTSSGARSDAPSSRTSKPDTDRSELGEEA